MVNSTTLKNYNFYYNKIKENNIDILNLEELNNFLNKQSNGNKLLYLWSIIYFNNNLKSIYQKIIDECNEVKKNNYLNNTDYNLVNYNNLLEKYRFNSNDIKNIINSFIIFIIVRYPIRNIFWNIKIVNSKKNINDDQNYIVINNFGILFIYNQFKNVKTFKTYEYKVTDKNELKTIRNYYSLIKKHNILYNDIFLYNYNEKSNEIDIFKLVIHFVKK